MAIKKHPILEKVRSPYFQLRNNVFIYRNLVNRRHKVSTEGFELLDSLQKKIVDDLNKNGIATIDFNKLFSDDDFLVLSNWITINEKNLKQKSKKKFLFSYYGTEDSNKPIDLTNPFVKFYLSEKILQIASTYLGYSPQLYEVYIEKTIPVGDSDPVQSQNWHRDPEEKKTLKIFLYLNDVTIESGPFTYILGSQPTSKSKLAKIFPQKLPHGSYPDSVGVKKLVNEENYFIATAPKATLIFCDTAGIHKGGYATKYERIMSTGFFPSKKYLEKPMYKVNDLSNTEQIEFQLNPLALKVLGAN